MRYITRPLKLVIIDVDCDSELLTKRKSEGLLMVIQHEENPIEISVCLPDVTIVFDPDEFKEMARQVLAFAEEKRISGSMPQEVCK
jgi:hypothetical protein